MLSGLRLGERVRSEESVGSALGDEVRPADVEQFGSEVGREVGVLICCDREVPGELEGVARGQAPDIFPREAESRCERDRSFQCAGLGEGGQHFSGRFVEGLGPSVGLDGGVGGWGPIRR